MIYERRLQSFVDGPIDSRSRLLWGEFLLTHKPTDCLQIKLLSSLRRLDRVLRESEVTPYAVFIISRRFTLTPGGTESD